MSMRCNIYQTYNDCIKYIVIVRLSLQYVLLKIELLVVHEKACRDMLHVIFFLEFLVFLPELVDTINHLLDKLNFRVSKPVLV